MKKKLKFLFFVSFFALTFPANASILDILSPGDIVTVKYIGPNGVTASGIYVGPYSFLVNGQPVDLVCNDPYEDDQISPGNEWQAVISFYDDLSRTRFGARPNAAELYGLIGILDQDIFAVGPTSYADDHTALLNFVDPTFKMTAGAPARQSWAQAQYAGGADLSRNIWLTPMSEGNQELGGLRATATPEPAPAASFLIGIGLMTVGLGNRRRRGQRRE